MAAALGQHLVVDGDDAVQHALHVDVDAALPRLERPRVVGVEGQRHDSGVVDHDVDGAEGLDGRRGQRPHLGDVGDVGRDRLGDAAGPADDRHHLLERVAPDVAAGDPGAPGRGLLAHEPTEATRGTGHDDRFSPDVVAHAVALPRGYRERTVTALTPGKP